MDLAVGVSEATMKSLLGKLGGLLAQEYALIRGVRGDIQYINDELASMQAFLRDLSTAPDGQDNRMKDWMKQIRDVAYDVEDCIDDFAHRLPHDSLSDVRCSFVVTRIYQLWTWWPRRDIASKISDLKVRAQQIAERRKRYGVKDPRKGNSNSSGDLTATYANVEYQLPSRQLIDTKEPVGMMTVMKKLEETGWVTNLHHEERAVLSIVGSAGVGKTTIATALYRKLGNKFDYRAFVTVSQNYDQDAVLRNILNQVKPQDSDHNQQGSSTEGSSTGSLEKNLAADIKSKLKQVVPLIRGHRQKDIETMNHDQLVQGLKARLAGKRYLLLIDDIWSAKTWESIRICLPDESKKGSRIIVTTRFHVVGATCCQKEEIDLLHTVDFLGYDESKDLFDQSVYESKNSEGSNQVKKEVPEEIWKEIWKICGGLPLAIVTMAGLVACNPSKSLFPERVTSLTPNGVTRILDCCYNDLPADLKTCLLYLSIFPKGWKVSRKRLTRRWIAEGFVSKKQGLTEEEVAETCFNQLIRRKIIRPVEHNSNGEVKAFQVHDMVLEYIVSKSSEENFITVVGGHWLMPAPSNKVRRLSMQSSDSKHGNSTKGMNLSQVRSLTVFGSLKQLPFHSFNDGIIQVLDLEGWNGLKEIHLKDICKMLVLKYLSLRRTRIEKIPSKIEKLEYLETLDIRETNVGELPKTVGQLKRISSILGGNKNLRKGLKLPQEKSKEPMKALRILSGIEIVGESTAVAGLHQFTELRKLAIYRLDIDKDGETFKELRSSIEYLGSCGLQTLAINDERSDFINSLDSMSAPPRNLSALELSGKLESLPWWITKLDSLTKLTLSVTVLERGTFNLLCRLSRLFSLTFSLSAARKDLNIVDILERNKSESDGEIFVPGEGFPSLKLLRFIAPLVPKLSFSENAMPLLERIEMRLEAFEGLFGIETLKSLQEVHLRVNIKQADEMTKSIMDDLKDYNTEKPKVIVDHVITD